MTARRAPQVLFRVAAGPRIGFGHLMRCRALSRALGARPVVSIRGGAVARRTAAALGCEMAAAATRLRRMDLVVVDDPSPAHAEAWLQRAHRAGAPTATIHDLGVGCRAADVIVDGSITHLDSTTGAGASVRAARRGSRALRGPRFTVLDPSVAAARAARRRRPTRGRPQVLVALGGGTHVRRAAATLVAAIARRCPHAVVHVASGFSGDTPGTLPAGARWIQRRHGLARDLMTCDVAITAGGVTLYEACAIGTPVVALAVVPEQRPAVEAFAARGAVIDAGAIADGDAALRRASSAVARLLDDQLARRRCSLLARRLVDGLGARRVADQLRALAAGAPARRRRHD